MVIEPSDEGPTEIKATHKGKKKYVIVKNHIRDLSFNPVKERSSSESSSEKQVLKKASKKHSNKRKNSETPVSEEINESNVEQIDPSDLEELKSVYKKCKRVIEMIETKYGHLLGLDVNGYTSTSRKSHNIDHNDEECQCSSNKKIRFDENGEQTYTETVKRDHICPSKLKKKTDTGTNNETIQIECEEKETLPDDLQTLTSILQDRNIEVTYRNEVINKIRVLKQEYMNNIRFDRPSLIEKLKQGSLEIFEFKGSNLLSLSGYPEPK